MTDDPAAPDMTLSPPRCPRCQTPLVGVAGTAGACPGCMMQLAIEPAAGTTTTHSGTDAAAAPSIDELQPLLPAYELQTLIGRGGMGAVYRARHLKLDRLVAIKVLLPDLVQDPAFAERFEREARALAKLDHPGIVGVHDFGRAGEFFYLVMEFVDGANLRDLLAHGRLTSRDVLQFVPQLCDALQYAHDQRIVHRDIKPENILIDQDGRVRIADFGLAKLLGQEPSAVGLTETRQAVGTPHYMAPEQIHAPGLVDHRADLYSLGVVLYEMLTGQLPIGRFAPPSTKASDAVRFDPVVMKSLESDPEQRYQQANEVKLDVEAGGSAEPRATESSKPTPVPTRQPPENWWHATLGAGLVFAASFLPWLELRSSSMFTGLRLTLTPNAWAAKMNGIPCWIVVVLALVASLLSTLRRFGQRIPAGSPFFVTMAGTLFCGFTLLLTLSTEDASPLIGLIATLLIFLVWNAAELRRHGEASMRNAGPARLRRQRRRATRRDRHATTP